MNTHPTPFDIPPQTARVLIHLLRGVLYRDRDEGQWQALLDGQTTVRAYLGVINLGLVMDEAEGFAFLRQGETDPEDENPLPRLVQRRPLSYPVSLLCVLLRKRLVEQDAGGGETRVILSREQIVDMLRVFLPEKGNEAKTVDRINTNINKVVELGFLRPLRGQDNQFEVRRILKALVDADWLADFDNRIAAYREHGLGEER